MEPLQHQRLALDEIVARARAFYDGRFRELAIQPRWHSLLTAPTGTGKTAVATMAAEAIGAKLLRVAAPAWIPASAKGSVKETIFTIAVAVAANDRTLLVIDEIDKISDRTGDNGWKTYCRGEIMDLADGRWPLGLKGPDDDDDEIQIPREALTNKLRETVFILAVGTFQDWFDGAGSRGTIGFGSENNADDDELTADIIADLLPREVANRFNSSIIRLPELQADHYHRIAKQATDSLPERMRHAFSEAVAARIGGAIEAKKGVRFLEECVMEALKNLPPEPVEIAISTKTNEPETPDPFDICTL